MAEASSLLKRARLPAAVADELRLCCLLGAEVVRVLLDAPLCPVVSATDASLHHGAAVEASCSLEDVAWLWPRTSAKAAALAPRGQDT